MDVSDAHARDNRATRAHDRKAPALRSHPARRPLTWWREFIRREFSDFCRRLLDDAAGPVFLVLDGHPVYRSGAVKAFAASTDGQLRLCFLPGHPLELNPDEWVWKNIEHDRIGRAGVTGLDDLKAKALAAVHRLQSTPAGIVISRVSVLDAGQAMSAGPRGGR